MVPNNSKSDLPLHREQVAFEKVKKKECAFIECQCPTKVVVEARFQWIEKLVKRPMGMVS